MSKSNVEVVEKYQLCYSADAYSGARPVAPLSLEGQLEAKKAQYGYPDARFQLTLEPEVSLSARKGKGGRVSQNADDQGVLEATIHFAFVLTDTAPIDGDDATSTGGPPPIQMGTVAHCHSEGELPQLMAGLDSFNAEKLFLTAAGLLLEGDQAPSFWAKMGLVTERIQKMLYNLVFVGKDVPPEDEPAFWGLAEDEELRRELRDFLWNLTPVVYLDVFWIAMDRLRDLLRDYERGKKESEAQLVRVVIWANKVSEK